MHKSILFLLLVLNAVPLFSMESQPTDLDEALFNALQRFGRKDGKDVHVDEEGLRRYLSGIENIFKFGANANALTKKQFEHSSQITPLEGALYWIKPNLPRIKVCELLFLNGANPNCREGKAFALACQKGDWNLFILFIKNGANCHVIDNYGKTMLHHAAEGGGVDICEYLLMKGLNLDVQDNQGNTPLHVAAKHKHNTLCKWLLEMGAKLNVYNHSKETPLELASDVPGQIRNESHYNTYPQSKKIDSFKNSRRICQDMIIHQVTINKNINTLLGCIKKLGAQGDPIASTLYRYRNALLRPYLAQQFCSLTQLLADQTPYKNLEEYRKKAYEISYVNGKIQYAYRQPIHEFQRNPDEYCGFLLVSAFKYTQNLSRLFFTDDWADGEILPLHYEQSRSNLAAAALAHSINNNNNIRVDTVVPIQAIATLVEPSPAPIATASTPAISVQLLPSIQPMQPQYDSHQQSQSDPVQVMQNEKPRNRFILKITVIAIIAVAAYLIYNWATNKQEETTKKEDDKSRRSYISWGKLSSKNALTVI